MESANSGLNELYSFLPIFSSYTSHAGTLLSPIRLY